MGLENPLIIFNGKKISAEKLRNKKLKGGTSSIYGTNDEAAIKLFGKEAKNGVIIFENVTIKENDEPTTIMASETPIFSKVEIEASIDITEWRKFLEINLEPIIVSVRGKMPAGQVVTVPIKFIVETNGSLSDITIEKDPGFGLKEKLIELMIRSPKWKPAIQNGKIIRAFATRPISFVLADE